jgi:hypothetical protein
VSTFYQRLQLLSWGQLYTAAVSALLPEGEGPKAKKMEVEKQIKKYLKNSGKNSGEFRAIFGPKPTKTCPVHQVYASDTLLRVIM